MIQSFKNLYHYLFAKFALIYFGYPAQNLTVIGVTGTDGKTTTSTIIYHLLNQAGFKVALISTVAAYIGDQSLDTGFHVTSPDPWQLQKLLKSIHSQGFTHLVLEATSHGLDQHRLLGTNIQIGVLTNISHEHLDYHKTKEAYTKAKSKLFQHAKIAILNRQDPSYSQIKPLIPKQTKIISYDTNTFPNSIVKLIKLRFSQPYNLFNATAAILAAKQLGVDPADSAKSLTSLPEIPGRMQSIANSHNIKAFVDFAHTPNALKNALTAAKAQTTGKLIAVYGSAGLRDQTKRPQMGVIGSEIADEIILTAEDPRTESVWNILDQMTEKITKNIGHVYKIPDRRKAINFAVKIAKPKDIVIVLGKGHEKSMCFGKIEYPWSDQETLATALEGKK